MHHLLQNDFEEVLSSQEGLRPKAESVSEIAQAAEAGYRGVAIWYNFLSAYILHRREIICTGGYSNVNVRKRSKGY